MGRQTIGQRIAPTRPEPAPGHPAPNMRGGQSRALRGGPAPAHVETLPGPLGASQPRWAHSGLVPPTHPGSARRSARPPWRKSSRRLQGARPRSDLGGYFHFRGEGGRAGGAGSGRGHLRSRRDAAWCVRLRSSRALGPALSCPCECSRRGRRNGNAQTVSMRREALRGHTAPNM